MRLQNTTFEATLSATAVDEISEKIREFLNGTKTEKRDKVRYVMSIEEILIKNIENGCEGAPVTVVMGYRLFRPFISVQIESRPNNVFVSDDTERSVLADGILKNLGLSPDYYYDGKNNYTFKIKKKTINPFISLMIAIGCAVTIGFLGLLLPDTFTTGAVNSFLDPMHNTFLNSLGCIAGPMIFLSVAWGIYGIGDAATLKYVGNKLIKGYIGTVYIVTFFAVILLFPIFSLQFSTKQSGGGEVSSIFTTLLGIVPKNIFSPFVDGNTLQIIFLAIVIGIALIFLGQKTDAVAKAVEQINYIVQFLIEFISRLVPYFIFIVIVKMIWSDTYSAFKKVGKIFLYFVISAVIMAIVIITVEAIKNKMSPILLIKKSFPVFVIAFTTASSAAAFGANMKTCKNEYGIDEKISSFGVPLGIVTFKPTTAVSYVLLSLFFAESYKIPVSATWLIILIFTAGILAIATPPIPGGALTAYTVLFSQIGIPKSGLPEVLAIALACDALFDFVNTGFDQLLLPVVLLGRSRKIGMVNEKILKNQ